MLFACISYVAKCLIKGFQALLFDQSVLLSMYRLLSSVNFVVFAARNRSTMLVHYRHKLVRLPGSESRRSRQRFSASCAIWLLHRLSLRRELVGLTYARRVLQRFCWHASPPYCLCSFQRQLRAMRIHQFCSVPVPTPRAPDPSPDLPPSGRGDSAADQGAL